MSHEYAHLPTQRQSANGVASVVAAAESAEYLRDQLELLPTATAAERDLLRHELALLRHWLHLTETESNQYQAVIDGLASVATDVEMMLTEAEAVTAMRA